MIVTLAGHVDHGKTALVRALTGIDTDRLEIEKKRGLTIELGFAYAEFEGTRVGFVDVPGHQKFIRNMIAGVSSEQFAMLVVAADEGPMPQTAEHLDIIETIGLKRGIVVFSRADLADQEHREKTETSTQALLKGSFLQDAECFWCCSHSGDGLDEIKGAIAAAASEGAGTVANDEQHFRLCVDRAFHLSGAGLIVTGAVHSGRIQVGDTLVSSRVNRALRVRSLRVADQSAEIAARGDRAAVNILGLELEQVKRGDWLLAPQAVQPTRRVSLDFQAIRRLPRSLRKWTSVHVHHGAAHLTGRLCLVERGALEAGERCLADCLLDEPVIAKWGDRVLVRDAASEWTLGGGPVIDTCIAKRGGRNWRQARNELLVALASDDAGASLHSALAHKPLIPLASMAALRNLSESHLQGSLKAGVRSIEVDGHLYATLEDTYARAKRDVLQRIDAWHRLKPDTLGLGIDSLRKTSEIPSALLRELIVHLAATKKIRVHAGVLQRAGFQPSHSDNETRLLQALNDLANKTPTLGDIEKLLPVAPRELRQSAKRLESEGALVFVNDRRLLHRDTLDEAIALARRLDTPDGFAVREFRDLAGHGRNACIDILEYLDRSGITRRVGDRRRINSGR